MSKIKCIIIEDEPLAVAILSDYISQVSFLQLDGQFKDAIGATEYLSNNTTDLMFLDIHLPQIKGITFLKTLPHPPAVIVTTAYHQYAVEGFSLNVTDYLLKPFEFERFLAAVMKAKTNRREIHSLQENPPLKDFIFLSVQKKKVRIQFSDIVYIESQKEYIKVVTTKKEFVSKMSTHEIEQLLPSASFKRIHRSFIVSTNRIDSYSAETVEINGLSIPVGRGYKDVLDSL